MTDLEYKIGRLEIDPERMRFEGPDPYYASHLFVVGESDDSASIYVSQAERHAGVARQFDLNDNIVGGGSCYTNPQKELVLNDYSGDYDAIPREAAQRFAELMQPELREMGVEVEGIAVNPEQTFLNFFWIDKGFDPQ